MDAAGQAAGGSANVFDAAGDRLSHTDNLGKTNQKTTNYLVDSDTSYSQVIEERAPDVSDAAAQPTLQARYVWGQGLAPLAMWRKGKDGNFKLFFHLSDGQESVRQLTDASGAVVDSYFYDAWGNTLDGSSNHVVNPFRYTGQQLDADGKYYLRARFYNPGTGRFLSHDPLMGDEDDPASLLHRYLYAGADGVNSYDPSGKWSLVDTLVTVGIIATIAAIDYRLSSNLSYRNYERIINVRPFTPQQQAVIDRLRTPLTKSGKLGEICDSLDNLQGVESLVNANAETRPLEGKPGYAIVLGDEFFDDNVSDDKRLTILIHECLHVYIGLGATKNAPNDAPHRRLSGWAKNLAEQTKNGYVNIPRNLKDVIINDAKPDPDQDYGDHTPYYGDDVHETEQP